MKPPHPALFWLVMLAVPVATFFAQRERKVHEAAAEKQLPKYYGRMACVCPRPGQPTIRATTEFNRLPMAAERDGYWLGIELDGKTVKRCRKWCRSIRYHDLSPKGYPIWIHDAKHFTITGSKSRALPQARCPFPPATLPKEVSPDEIFDRHGCFALHSRRVD